MIQGREGGNLRRGSDAMKSRFHSDPRQRRIFFSFLKFGTVMASVHNVCYDFRRNFHRCPRLQG